MPASLPRASNVAKVGSSPVLTLEFVGPLLVSFENTQKAFTFPPNWKAHPLDICIVRPCALAVAETPSAKPNNNSVRRFIRDSLLGSLLPPSYRSCPRGAYATARARYSRVGRFSHQYSSGFSPTLVCEQTGESGAHLLESESIGTPRSREAKVSPQEWPPTTACELSPKPRDEPTCRPHRECPGKSGRNWPCGKGMGVRDDLGGMREHAVVIPEVHHHRPPQRHRQRQPAVSEPVEVEGAVETGETRNQLEGDRLGYGIDPQPRRIDGRSGRGNVALRANHNRRRRTHRHGYDTCDRPRLHRGEPTTASREAEELKNDEAAAHCGA